MTAMRSATRILVAAAMLSFASACIRGTVPARELYRLRLPEPAGEVRPAVGAPAAALEGSIAIAPYETPGLYDERGIVFRVGESAYGVYPSREWALPLGEMLGMLTEPALAGARLAADGARYDPPSRRSHAFLWRGAVREFEEVNRGNDVLAAVHLEATLIRAETDSVLWNGSARRERAVAQPTMDRIVQTLSDLAAEVMAELARDAAAKARAPSASTARSTP